MRLYVCLFLIASDLFKTQLQTQVFQAQPRFTTFLGTVRHIGGEHGIRGCYQGLAPTIMRNVPAVACYFGVYEGARLGLCAPGQKLEDLESWKLLTAGSLGGFAYWAFTYPLDCVKSAMQADSCVPAERRFKGTVDCAKQLYKEGGVARFFKGVAPCILRAAPANATCFFLYQKVDCTCTKNRRRQQGARLCLPISQRAISSGCSAAIDLSNGALRSLLSL